MVTPSQEGLKGLQFLRRNGGGLLTEALVNFVLPFVIYGLARPHWGDVRALIASSAPPIAWSLAVLAIKRQVDFISAFVLAGIALSLLAMLGGGSVKVLQLRDKMVTALIGLAFLASAAVGRPLIYEFARAGMKRRRSAELARFESLRNNQGFRRAMTLMTVVWGVGLLADAGVAIALVQILTIKQYLIAGPIVGYGFIGALALWTFLYARERRRRGQASQRSA